MARLLVVAAALLAAGCRVDVDGAPCAVPGTSADCPGGQACGNDLRCSARALACATSRCPPGAVECTATAARRCETGPDPVCGRWVARSCGARDPACRIIADPRVVSPERGPTPPGTPDPPECRFARLGDALDAAAARFPAAVVEVDGEGAATVAFGAATAEEWPLVVASNVALAGATPAGPAVIRGGAGLPALLAVQGTVEDLRVDADGATTAVRVTRAGARLVRVEVSSAAGAALQIEADPASAATVEVLGGSYAGSGLGIWIRRGRVSVAPDPAHATTAVASANPGSTVVRGNLRDGIVIGGYDLRGLALTGAVFTLLERVSVQSNAGTGVIIAGLPPASRVLVLRCDVHANGATDPVAYGASGLRNAGGLLVSLPFSSGLVFRGNRVWANARDQLAFDSSATDWTIAAPACGADTNVFATCLPPTDACNNGACAVSVEGGGAVSAQWNAWPTLPPYSYATLNQVTGIDAPTCCDGGPEEPPSPCP